jgi:hypothetical protein
VVGGWGHLYDIIGEGGSQLERDLTLQKDRIFTNTNGDEGSFFQQRQVGTYLSS